jgi:hypothetical protein
VIKFIGEKSVTTEEGDDRVVVEQIAPLTTHRAVSAEPPRRRLSM